MTQGLHLGALLDDGGQRGNDLRLDPDDLTTHGVIVGMTGSGKTGLGVVLLEECARAGIGTLVIDPKGDLANLALRFPSLSPEEFRPWVDAAAAQRQGVSVDELAERTAAQWREGLAAWNLGPADLANLHEAADVTVYTPGSTAGVALSMLGSLAPPALDWATDEDALRDEIASFVDGLLALSGVKADPLASREHALVATIIETAWRQQTALDPERLIGQVLAPPFRKLGVFDVDTFFPASDRKDLALRLNALLATPSAAAWLQGDPVDVGGMVATPEGKPRCAVVSVAHLSDDERQFAVAVILSKVVTWMRTLPGTGELRCLIYMDEVAGFAPPTAVPPAKAPMLTIMKQARAFGVGMILAMQNPVDLDYRAIGNAGTWMIGRLQTARDRDRLLDGMSSAAGTVDVAALSDAIAALDKRQFILHRSGGAAPQKFTTRWAMSYLRGPFTRVEIAALTQKTPAVEARPSPLVTSSRSTDTTTPVPPQVAAGWRVTYLDPAAPWAQQVGANAAGSALEAALAFRIELHYRNTRADVDHTEEWEAVFHPLKHHLTPDSALTVDYDDRDLRTEPTVPAAYVLPDAPLDDESWLRGVEKRLVAHVRVDESLEVPRNSALKLYGRAGESVEDFAVRCATAAAGRADAEAAKLANTLEDRITRKRASVESARRRQAAAAAEVETRRSQEVVSGAGALLGVLLGGGSRAGRAARGASGAASRRGMTQRAAQRLEDAAARTEIATNELADLEQRLVDEVAAIHDKWQAVAAEIDTVPITATAADVRVVDRAVVWVLVT